MLPVKELFCKWLVAYNDKKNIEVRQPILCMQAYNNSHFLSHNNDLQVFGICEII